MSTSTTERILTNRATESQYGWLKTTDTDNSIIRTIRVGNLKNCNGDSVICDHSIKKNMELTMEKYGINNYELKNIHTDNEFSYEISMLEDEYSKFVSNLK